MAVENETAEQVVRMVLQGTEVVLRLSGEAAVNVAKLIYAALKGDHTTKGRATLWEFLKSGKDQKIFQIPDEYLKAFTTASKKFGFPFVVLRDKNSKTGLTDIMVYATDAAKVNRVIENLNLAVKRVETIKPEIVSKEGEYIKPLGMQLKVPFELIDNFPKEPKDMRLLSQLQKYASKMRTNGPQVVEPIGLLCKPDGRYEVLPGEGSKRLLALRLAGYKEAVAEISVPKNPDIEVKAENIDERPPQDRIETPKNPKKKKEPSPVEQAKKAPSKEEGQTVNPTMARTRKEQASGRVFRKRSKDRDTMEYTDLTKRPSVRNELERCKKISEDKEALKIAQKSIRPRLFFRRKNVL